MKRFYVMALFHGISLGALCAQSNNGRARQFETSVFDAGPTRMAISTSGVINPDSALMKRGLVIHDDSCPIHLNGVAPKTVYDPPRRFRFLSSGEVQFNLSTSAYEIRTIVLDPFGEGLQTISLTDISDKQVGAKMALEGHSEWPASDREGKTFFSSVSFVASVLTAEGRVWRFDGQGILAEAQKLRLHSTSEEFGHAKRIDSRSPAGTTDAMMSRPTRIPGTALDVTRNRRKHEAAECLVKKDCANLNYCGAGIDPIE